MAKNEKEWLEIINKQGSILFEFMNDPEQFDVLAPAHQYACDKLNLPYSTTTGGDEGESDLPENHPHYKLYWDLVSSFFTKVLISAAALNERVNDPTALK